MGVTGLWTVVKPCARPIKLETLNKKRLAVDASIWIYQFLKAVRDKEGNALRNAHVVGFFRRICKLLYFGIKPVFVFDGGAPSLKRQTINARKKRREGRREDATRTASKLLVIQLQKLAEEEEVKRKARDTSPDEPRAPLPENMVYAEEVFMNPRERMQNRRFRKKDAYHLPELDVSLAEMGAPNDPRIMSHEELEEYARQFHSGENINLYDFSNIDFDSPFFLSLPASDRYNILNAARLRSRLRMGYSKDQLDSMFPDRMAFSRFQIERVKERNDLTQRLMNINGMNGEDTIDGSSFRIAGERNKEYVLVKDNGVEGGWALGVLGNREGEHESKPIDLEADDEMPAPKKDGESDDEDVEFEDVPIFGINRLANLPFLQNGVFDASIDQNAMEVAQKRQQVYDSRRQAAGLPITEEISDNDELFVPDNTAHDHLFEDSEDENLRNAIQMSLKEPEDVGYDDDEDGMAALLNENTDILNPPTMMPATKARKGSVDVEDDETDLFSAIAKSKATDRPPAPGSVARPFEGALPFKPFKVTRITKTGKTEVKQVDETAGGFEPPEDGKDSKTKPLPPWFMGNSSSREFVEQETDDQYSGEHRYQQARQYNDILAASNPTEVIDLEKEDHQAPSPTADQPLVLTPESPQIELESHHDKASSSAIIPGSVLSEERAAQHSPSKARVSENLPINDEAATGLDIPEQPPALDLPDPVPVEATRSSNEPGSPIVIPLEQYDEAADYDNNEFSDPEDAELIHQLAAEAEEHARFASTLNSKSQAENAHDYERELKQLRTQQKKDRRDADEVSQIMVTECQQLLKLFGLPYVTAPMEAEAQCAELVSLGLVDGIVTDDSDIFLFGGNRIYKNMFNQAKFVECYLKTDLEKEYSLDRKKLISFAHLLGSDYTEGIPGIGPVTALEILTEFSGLEEFRVWWSKVQMGTTIPDDMHSKFRKKFKKNAGKLFLPPAFPDERVDTAYLEPEVDSDPSPFQWGVPDLAALRQFLMTTIGWSPERTDEVLVPVIRDVNRRELEGTQANITQFFEGSQGAGAFAPRRRATGQTRMEKAFTRLRHEAAARQGRGQSEEAPIPVDESDEIGARPAAVPAKRRRKKDPTGAAADDEPSNNDKTTKHARRKRQKATGSSTTLNLD